MTTRKSKRYKPHELALHVAALFLTVPNTDMGPVQMAMKHAVQILTAADPAVANLADPDFGIPYILAIKRTQHSKEVEAAAELLQMCLHAVERSVTNARDRVFIPMLLTALVGFVPDRNARSARHNRPTRTQRDALDRGLIDALIAEPSSEWKALACWLEGQGVVTEWSLDSLTFTDGDVERTIAIGTFWNRITKARGRQAKYSLLAG